MGSATFRYFRIMEICDLIYNNILEIDYIINVSISDLYIDFNSNRIVEVR